MKVDKVKFCIISQARSGSTLLREALHSHPDIVCHGEVLSRVWINKLVPKDSTNISKRKILSLMNERENDVGDFLDRYIYIHDCKAVGFKLIYEDIFLQNDETRLAILNWLKDNDIKIFHLVRLNFLEALVSRKRMSLHNISHKNISSISKNKVGMQEKEGRVEINAHEIKEYCFRQTMYRNSIDLHFLNATTMHYETIFSDYNLVLKELQVEGRVMDIKMKKLNRRGLQNVIINYDEVSGFDISKGL